MTLPPFSLSRQTLRFQVNITPAAAIATAIATLPHWGRWWIATPIWRWQSVRLNPNQIQLTGQSLLGRARLDWIWTNTRLHVTFVVDPYGILGIVYWIFLWPIHRTIFPVLLSTIHRKACHDRPSH
ncbi:DUF2867 domain-containing protein [bacterium]|nr:DUF2867 domain-containing protein [bacterium]